MSTTLLIETGSHGLPTVPGVRYRYEASRQPNQSETVFRMLPPSLWSPECILQCLNFIDFNLGNRPLANWFRKVTTTTSTATSAERKGLPNEPTASITMRNYFITKAQELGVNVYDPGNTVSVYESPTTADTTSRTGNIFADGRFQYSIDRGDLSLGYHNAFHIQTKPDDASIVSGLRPVNMPFLTISVSIDAMNCTKQARPGGLRDVFYEASQEALWFALFAHDMNSSLPNAQQQAVHHILRAQRAIDSITHAGEQNPLYPSPDAITTTLALATLVQPLLHKLPKALELDKLLMSSTPNPMLKRRIFGKLFKN